MPIHDFRCADCAQVFEALVRGTATPVCPNCASQRLERLISAPAAPGASAGMVERARSRAAAEGHFSHYGKGERRR